MSPLSFTTARSAGPVFEGIMLWFWLASPRRAGQRGDGHALILPLSAADAANRISQQKKIRQVSAAQTRTAKFVANAEVALDRRTLLGSTGAFGSEDVLGLEEVMDVGRLTIQRIRIGRWAK